MCYQIFYILGINRPHTFSLSCSSWNLNSFSLVSSSFKCCCCKFTAAVFSRRRRCSSPIRDPSVLRPSIDFGSTIKVSMQIWGEAKLQTSYGNQNVCILEENNISIFSIHLSSTNMPFHEVIWSENSIIICTDSLKSLTCNLNLPFYWWPQQQADGVVFGAC